MAAIDERDFGELYRSLSRPLWAYVYRVTGQASDADDIVQDAFCRLLGAEVGGLDAEELRRYVFRIASNLVTDRWRRARREQSWLARLWREPVTDVSGPADADDTAKAFRQLKPRDRAILWLAYVEEEPHQRIAEILGLSRGSVKVLLSRARTRLKGVLTAEGTLARGK